MFYILGFLWLIRETKSVLFWLYLWQLKEYHLGRFLDHFRTEKGKKIILNRQFAAKIFLLVFGFYFGISRYFFSWSVYVFWIGLLIILYFLESLKTLRDIFGKKIKKPSLSPKAAILSAALLISEILFLFFLLGKIKIFYWFAFWLLVFDILTFLIVSFIIAIFQIPTYFLRIQIINKAKKKREALKNLLVVGITGSFGKTSTKEFLATILAEKFNVLKTEKNQNSEMGISRCILKDLKPEQEIFVCEMGAYNKGGIKLLCDIAKPKIGILTGISQQHLATFGSQENIIKTKFELIESLPEDGVAILNGDNEFIKSKIKNQKSKRQIKNQKLYSIIDKTDIWAENIKAGKEEILFNVFSKEGDKARFKIKVLGSHNVLNVLGAVAVAKEIGMNLKEISKACQKIRQEQGGMILKKGKNGINIIDSSYSANPDGVLSDLEYLKVWKGKRIIIMPCLIELGKASKEIHNKIGEKIGEVCDLAIVTAKDRFEEIKKEALNKGMEEENILFLESPKEIIEKTKDFLNEKNVILLEGKISENIKNLFLK